MNRDELIEKINSNGLKGLTDEELKEYLSLAVNNLVDEDGKHLVFQSYDEAVIYAAQLQRNIPSIRFFKIVPCYSNVVGNFYCIEPNVTDYSQKNFKVDSQYETNEDFVLVNKTILMAIVESAERESAKAKAEEEALKAKMEQ